jgi:hypothetical protein
MATKLTNAFAADVIAMMYETSLAIGNFIVEVMDCAPKHALIDMNELNAIEQTSSKIRYCVSKGMKDGDIARLLGKRHQHVRNVRITPVKKG